MALAVSGPPQQGVGHVYADHLASGSHQLSGDDAIEPATGTNVQYGFAGCDFANGERVANSGEGLYSGVGQSGQVLF
jgi:hypothetical protein